MPASAVRLSNPRLHVREDVLRRLSNHLAVGESVQREGQRARPLEEEHLGIGHLGTVAEQGSQLPRQFLLVNVEGNESGADFSRAGPRLFHRRRVRGDVACIHRDCDYRMSHESGVECGNSFN